MFTGIVEEVGILRKITANGKSGKVTILSNKILDGTNLGDSIAVNGVCLTVSNLGKRIYSRCYDGDNSFHKFRFIKMQMIR